MRHIFSNALLTPIYSFNLKGKIKYAFKDMIDAIKKNYSDDKKAWEEKSGEREQKKKERKEKSDERKRYFTDELTKDDVSNHLKGMGINYNVGPMKLISSEDGKYYKVICGNPVDKNFYGYVFYRNGNDIRIVKEMSFGGGKNFDPDSKQASKEKVMEWYNSPDPDYEGLDESIKKGLDRKSQSDTDTVEESEDMVIENPEVRDA